MASSASASDGFGLGRWLLRWVIGPLIVLAMGAYAVISDPPGELVLGALAKSLQKQTGYTLSYDESAKVAVWPVTRLELRNVRIGRPSVRATGGGDLLKAKRVTATIDPRLLLQGSRTIDTIEIEAPDLRLADADLRRLQSGSNTAVSSFRIRSLTLRDGTLGYDPGDGRKSWNATEIQAQLRNISANKIDHFKGRLRWRGQEMNLQGTMARGAGNNDAIKQTDLTLTAKAPVGVLSFKGGISPGASTRIDGDVVLKVGSIYEAAQLFEIAIDPSVPAWSGAATVQGPISINGQKVHLQGAQVTTGLGAGRLDITLDHGAVPAKISGSAAWKRLDLNQLSQPQPSAVRAPRPLISGTAPAPRAEIPSAWTELDRYLDGISRPTAPSSLTRSPPAPSASIVRAARAARSAGVSADEIDFSALGSLDLDLKQSVEKLHLGRLAIDDSSFTTRLASGKLTVDIDSAGFAAGTWRGQFAIDARTAMPEHTVALKAADIDARELQEWAVGRVSIIGRGDMDLNLSARGRSVQEMLKSLSGRSKIEVRKGHLIGFDLKAVFNQWWRKWTYSPRRRTPFDTVRANLRFNNGIARTTVPATLRGRHVELDSSGSVSLSDRRLNQRVRARLAPPPEHLPIPVRISGAWSAPKVKLDFNIFSGAPSRHTMPFAFGEDQALALRSSRTRSLSAAPSGSRTMPAAVRRKLEGILANPESRARLSEPMRRSLEKLVE